MQGPSKVYQRGVFIVFYTAFTLVIMALVGYAVTLEKAWDADRKSDLAARSVSEIKNAKPKVTIVQPSASVINEIREKVKSEVEAKGHQEREAIRELAVENKKKVEAIARRTEHIAKQQDRMEHKMEKHIGKVD